MAVWKTLLFGPMISRLLSGGYKTLPVPPGAMPTFSLKGLVVYGGQGFFDYQGVRRQISDVRSVEYEEGPHQGTGGGKYIKLHIWLHDLQTPRLTLRYVNFTPLGNQKARDDHERLCIALNCR